VFFGKAPHSRSKNRRSEFTSIAVSQRAPQHFQVSTPEPAVTGLDACHDHIGYPCHFDDARSARAFLPLTVASIALAWLTVLLWERNAYDSISITPRTELWLASNICKLATGRPYRPPFCSLGAGSDVRGDDAPTTLPALCASPLTSGAGPHNALTLMILGYL